MSDLLAKAIWKVVLGGYEIRVVAYDDSDLNRIVALARLAWVEGGYGYSGRSGKDDKRKDLIEQATAIKVMSVVREKLKVFIDQQVIFEVVV